MKVGERGEPVISTAHAYFIWESSFFFSVWGGCAVWHMHCNSEVAYAATLAFNTD